VPEAFKYRAFLSYGRADAGVARQVRNRLEKFPIDRDLVGHITPVGPVPEAIRPIFHSEHDFFTRPSLGAATAEALAGSAAFIILASPHSAQSKYVNKQVRLFKSRYPERPVVVLIVEGTPEDGDAEHVTPPLRFAVAPEWAENPATVLPPDLDQKGDGLEFAIAKVAARLIGVAPEDLYYRAECDRLRRSRMRIAAATATAVLIAVGGIASWQSYQHRLMRAEIAGLVSRYRLVSPSYAAVPGGKESLTQAITAIGEGAATEPRYGKVLELLKTGHITEATPALLAVAQDKAKRTVKYAKDTAAAYRTVASVAAISDPGAARAYYAAAARLDPSDVEGMFRNGWFQQQAGRIEAAEASYNGAIRSSKVRNSEWVLWAQIGKGDVERERGRLAEALAAYREAGAIAQSLAAAEPGDPDLQYIVGISDERIGDVLMAQGDQTGALKSYEARQQVISRLVKGLHPPSPAAQAREETGDRATYDPVLDVLASHQVSLAVTDRLAKANLRDAGWQRDLAAAHDRVGNLLAWQDHLPEALKSYQATLGIVDRLARGDPGNAGWQRDVALSYARIGDVLAEQHSLPDALKSYQASLAVAEKLAQADPDNIRQQGELSATHGKIGDVLAEQDNLPDALKSYRASLAIAERFANADRGNLRWQRELWATYGKIGGVLAEQGSLAEAVKFYRASLAVAERLAKVEPGNAGWQSELSEMYDTLGNVLKAQGDLPEAVKSYSASLAIAEGLAAADPGNSVRQHDLAVGHAGIGDLLKALGRLPEALTAYSASLVIMNRLAWTDGNLGGQRDLSVAYSEVGEVLKAQGNLPEALKSYQASLAIIGRLARTDTANTGWQRDLSATHSGVGDVLMAQGKLREALKSYQDSVAIVERLAKADPGNAAWQRDLSVTYVRLADFYRKSGKDTLARKTLVAARVIMARLVTQFPHQAQLKQDYGWFGSESAALKK
jgi:tetratricopeptide (TPR) repeat protein